MANVSEDYTRHFDQVMKVLCGRGLLLASYDANGRANAMTIGWGAVGSMWGMPIWQVMVRPSRYTYKCIEASRAFCVCVPTTMLTSACTVCGSQSGRAGDKLAALNLSVRRGEAVNAPIIEACPIVYECSVVHSSDINPGVLAREINTSAYANGDYHRVYWGKIEAMRLAEDAAERLAR